MGPVLTFHDTVQARSGSGVEFHQACKGKCLWERYHQGNLFQSLNIEVQDVSPDLLPVMTVIPPTSTVTRGIRDISYVKGNRYHFSRLVFLVSRRKNGLKRDQFNTLLIDRKERCATYKCSTVYSL